MWAIASAGVRRSFFVWFLGWWVGKPWKAILSTQSFHHVDHVPWRIVPATGIHGMILHKQNSAVIPEILLKRCEKLPFFASNSYPKNSGRFAKSLFLVFNPFCCFNAENFPVDITMVCWCQVFLNSSSMKMTQIRSQAHRILRYFLFNVSLVTYNCNKGYPKIYDLI